MSKKVDALLSANFVEEMLRLAFANKGFAEIVVENLDLSNFPRELGGCKAMLKVLSDTMKESGSLATYGTVEMTFPTNEDVKKKISEVKALPLPEYEPMVKQLETFIRRQSFVAAYNEAGEVYNEGRQDEAMELLGKRIGEINEICFTEKKGKFNRVYRDFYKNVGTVQIKSEDETHRQKMPFGITSLDDITDGGCPRGDTTLMVMRSGVGKSTFLKYVAWYNTSIAHNHVLHIQCEGGEEEAVIKFDQMIANTTYSKIMRGELSDDTYKRIEAIIKRAKTVNSDIDVYASEELMELSMAQIVQVIEDYYTEYGYYPDLVTLDSLDLVISGENKKIDFDPNFIKYRLQKCAQRLKDIATKYDLAIVTATQTSNVPFEVWNDPTRFITRENTEGDRTLVKPFSFVFTGNVTIDEAKAHILRIYVDKFRNYQNNGIIIQIPTNYENGYFYDIAKSREVEKILDMSALDSLNSRRSKKRDGSDSTGTKTKVEISPGVWVTKVVGPDGSETIVKTERIEPTEGSEAPAPEKGGDSLETLLKKRKLAPKKKTDA